MNEMRNATLTTLLVWTCWSGTGKGQTLVDLRTQSKSIDFSAASSTRPLQVGTVLPVSCVAGAMFFNTSAPDGANVYGCTVNNVWALQTAATSSNRLADFAVTRTSSTTLLTGASCSTATPCGVRFGGVTFPISNSGTVTLTAGTGLAYFYIASSGALTVGTNLTATCSIGCAIQAGIAAFPANSIPLATWSATSGTWDTAGGADFRAFLSNKSVIAATGLVSSEAAGATTLTVDGTVVALRTATPATSSTACTAGTWATDGTWYYLCVSANTWKRVAILTW